jgi:hypothetical protein
VNRRELQSLDKARRAKPSIDAGIKSHCIYLHMEELKLPGVFASLAGLISKLVNGTLPS